MKKRIDWNHERYRTRDLLLDNHAFTLHPEVSAQDIQMIYPWENKSLSILNHQLYLLAAKNGYEESEQEFNNVMGDVLDPKDIIFLSFTNFPENGNANKLYFDVEEKVLYYWDNDYLPVNARFIADLITNQN